MTPRDRYRRIMAYARASANYQDYRQLRGWHRSEGPWGMELLAHERHAWGRLPENMRRQVKIPLTQIGSLP